MDDFGTEMALMALYYMQIDIETATRNFTKQRETVTGTDLHKRMAVKALKSLATKLDSTIDLLEGTK